MTISAWAPRLRRPPGLVEQARWLFCLSSLLVLTLTLPSMVDTAANSQTGLALAVGGVLVLGSCWVYRYLKPDSTALIDLVQGASFTAIALACAKPDTALIAAFASQWFQALYGSTKRVYFGAALTALGAAAAAPLWALVPGHAAETPIWAILGPLPSLFLIVSVGRYLGLSLFAREQAQFRDEAVARLGRDLLALTNRAAIDDRAWSTVVEFVSATPGLRALGVHLQDGDAAIIRWSGQFNLPLPAQLPHDILGESAIAGTARPLTDDSSLRAAVNGTSGDWVHLAMPLETTNLIVVGAPKAVLLEVTVAFASISGQVALAMRNSDSYLRLATAATTDALTGLSNRAAFSARVRPLEPSTGFAVLYLDLDGFKDINDSFGHAAGDKLLREVAARLERTLRPDDFCARLGGDEFAVLIHDSRPGVAGSVGERLIDSIGAPVALGERFASVGVSVGLAYGSPTLTLEEVVNRADNAMYTAKSRGKNQVQVFDQQLADARAERDQESPRGEAPGLPECGRRPWPESAASPIGVDRVTNSAQLEPQ